MEAPEPTIITPELRKEMEEFFELRTKAHIEAVNKWSEVLKREYKEEWDFSNHDSSKFSPEEREGYIYLTWAHKCKRDQREFHVSEDMQKEMNQTILLHKTRNSHHPEYWGNQEGVIINACKMPREAIAEMVCDWLAMAEELGCDVIHWANSVIGIRWSFHQTQIQFIYQLLDLCKTTK